MPLRRNCRRIAEHVAKSYGARDPDKSAIAAGVQRYKLPQGGFGTCFWSALIGREILKRHGIETRMQMGSLLYNGGDGCLLEYGPRGRAEVRDDGLHAHIWLTHGDTLIDFSPLSWRTKFPAGALLPTFAFIWTDANRLSANPPALGHARYAAARDASTDVIDLDAMATRGLAELHRLNPGLLAPARPLDERLSA